VCVCVYRLFRAVLPLAIHVTVYIKCREISTLYATNSDTTIMFQTADTCHHHSAPKPYCGQLGNSITLTKHP